MQENPTTPSRRRGWMAELRESLSPAWKENNKRRLEELEIKRQELALQQAEEEKNQIELPLNANEPIVWKDTAISLGEWILNAYWKGSLQADTPQQAVRQSLKHFMLESKNGMTPPNADSIEAMLRRDDKFRDPR